MIRHDTQTHRTLFFSRNTRSCNSAGHGCLNLQNGRNFKERRRVLSVDGEDTRTCTNAYKSKNDTLAAPKRYVSAGTCPFEGKTPLLNNIRLMYPAAGHGVGGVTAVPNQTDF